MIPREKALEMARKLLELSLRGEAGERENAERMLDACLKKHHISLDEVEGEEMEYRQFKFTSEDHKRFMGQVIASVVGPGRDFYGHKDLKKTLVVPLTLTEYVEVALRIDHYWELWLQEVEIFRNAFIQANHLYMKRDKQRSEPETVSREEFIRRQRIRNMMDTIRTSTPHKRLNEAS